MNRIENNMNLVHGVIHKYFDGYRKYIDYDDMFQVGCLALVKANKNYNSDKKNKFETYAYQSIYNEIMKMINKERTGAYNAYSKKAIDVKSLNEVMYLGHQRIERINAIEDRCVNISDSITKLEIEEFRAKLEGLNKKIFNLMLLEYQSLEIAKILINNGEDITYRTIQHRVKRLKECLKAHLEGENYNIPKNRGRSNKRSAKAIIGINIENGLILEFPSIHSATVCSFDGGHISEVCKGKKTKHKGFRWFYRDEN